MNAYEFRIIHILIGLNAGAGIFRIPFEPGLLAIFLPNGRLRSYH